MTENFENFDIITADETNHFSLGNSPGEKVLKNPASVYLLSLGSKFSRNGMKNALMRFARFYGFQSLDEVPWEQIEVGTINLFKAHLEKNELSPNSINTYLAALRGVIKAAWQMELISDHKRLILSTVKSVRGSRVQTGRALSQIETSKLISACSDSSDPSSLRDVAIVSLGIGSGLRRNELSSLKISDIDFSDQKITVIGKGNKQRLVTATEIVFIRLQKWLEVRGKDGCPELFVCIGKHGDIRHEQKMSPMAIFKMIEKRAKAARIEKFTPHDLRRTFATRMLDVGADISIVKEAMGHSSINTTQRYDRRGFDKVRDYIRAIAI